jgi:hypothetical protein
MKTCRGSGGIAPCIRDLGTSRGEWLASRPGLFTLRERTSGTHWIGGWMGPRAVLGMVVVKLKLFLCLTKHHAMNTYGEVEV